MSKPDRPLLRTQLESADLRTAWEEHAADFIAWAREPGWQHHRDQFLDLLPPPGGRTLDLGCGEGRLSRDLKALGHYVVGIDVSPTMVAAARELDPELELHVADAASLPFPAASFDLVVAFMSLQDVNDYRGGSPKRVVCSRPAGGSASRSSTL